MKYAELGSVSTATLRDEDLMGAFLGELEWQLSRQERTPENRDELDRLRALHDELSDEFYDDDGEFIDSDEASYAINEQLFDALNEFAAPYCYFGSHEGDGADFGYWPCWDAINELPKYDSIEESLADAPENSEEHRDDYAIVNDHGNITIYNSHGDIIGEFV